MIGTLARAASRRGPRYRDLDRRQGPRAARRRARDAREHDGQHEARPCGRHGEVRRDAGADRGLPRADRRPIDNIPGIEGVGPKTAAKWLEQYPDVATLKANAAQVTGKIGDRLRAALDTLDLSKELATIRCDVELPLTLDELHLRAPDVARLTASSSASSSGACCAGSAATAACRRPSAASAAAAGGARPPPRRPRRGGARATTRP